MEPDQAVKLACKTIEAACYEVWPDVVLITSGFYVPEPLYGLLRARGHKVVLLHTESPYEDDEQIQRAPHADLNILNDPTNLDRFQAVAPSAYVPHAYDPDVHRRRPPSPDVASDFAFVGTAFPSRVALFEAVDWTGIDVALAGAWQGLRPDSPLRKFVAHDLAECVDNTDTVDYYSSTKVSANVYRDDAGWACGPREIELAAIGTPFIRQRRPESDALFPMLPTFDGPEDFAATLRWLLSHDDEREAAAQAARAAVADRTFAANAAHLLRLLDRR